MINAQEWLDKNYPKEIRSGIKQLYLKKKGLKGSLDLKDFVNLQSLHCANNQLTSLSLSGLKNLEIISCRDNHLNELNLSSLDPEKITYLDLRSNNFSERDLSVFSDFINLRLLWIGNDDREKITKNIYNRFIGSLKPLRNLINLKSLYINNTDIDSGVKYLPSDIQEINYSTRERTKSKLSKIEKELDLFLDFKGKGKDWKVLHPDFAEQENKKQWKNLGFYYPETKKWIETGLSPREYHFAAWLRWNGYNPQKNLNWEELRKKSKSAQEWLDKEYPLDKKKWISWLDVSRSGLEGDLVIEDFPNLERMDCYRNQLNSISLKNLPKLAFFDITNNDKLASLTIDNCPMITDFYASNNSLTSLDFLKALDSDRLTKLYIDNNNFLSCDVSTFCKFRNLKNLNLANNRFCGNLQSLNNLKKLEELSISDTKINDDFEHLPDNLKEFWCSTDKDTTANLLANEQGMVEKNGRGGIKNFPQKLQDYKQWISLKFTKEEKNSWISAGLKLSEAKLADYFRQKGYQPNSSLKEIIVQESWRNIHPDFSYPLRKKWEKKGFGCQETKKWIDAEVRPDEYEFVVWLRDIKKVDLEWILNNQEEFQDLKAKYKYFGTCKECQQPNTGSNWCQACNNQHWKENFSNWTSGSQVVDEFIQAHQLEATDPWNNLEWIPYEKFTKVEHIADGGFGKVYKTSWQDGPIRKWSAKHKKWKREANKNVALKSLNNSQNLSHNFLPELSYYKMFKSKASNLVSCYGISRDIEGNYAMVMQFMEKGNLREYLKNNYRELSFEDKFEQLIDIARGLKWIHDRKLVHRDFHAGNILYPPCRISDLGLCKPVGETDDGKIYGVLPYVAPEVLNGKPYTQASDIYSFGIIAYEVLTGLPPYSDRKHDHFLGMEICKGIRPEFKIKIPQLLENLIKQCWNDDPQKRPTSSELEKILNDWNESYWRSDIEFKKQIQEAEEHNKTLPEEVKCPQYKIHHGAVYRSQLLPTKEITKLLQSSQISGSSTIDMAGLLDNLDNVSLEEKQTRQTTQSTTLVMEMELRGKKEIELSFDQKEAKIEQPINDQTNVNPQQTEISSPNNETQAVITQNPPNKSWCCWSSKRSGK